METILTRQISLFVINIKGHFIQIKVFLKLTFIILKKCDLGQKIKRPRSKFLTVKKGVFDEFLTDNLPVRNFGPTQLVTRPAIGTN